MTNLVRVTRGIWRAADELTDLAARCAAVLAAMPPATVIGGPTAARLHGLWLPEPCDEPIEVVLNDPGTDPRELPGSVRPEVHARRRALRREEIVVAHGLPTTSEARTWVDLAESLPAADLVAAGDSVLRGPTGIEDLLRAVRSAAGRRGVVRAREALPYSTGGRGRGRRATCDLLCCAADYLGRRSTVRFTPPTASGSPSRTCTTHGPGSPSNTTGPTTQTRGGCGATSPERSTSNAATGTR